MKVILTLLQRNLRLYFRDKRSVFFSLMSVLIIIGLYALFLGNIMSSNINNALHNVKGVREFVDTWIMSGLLLVNAVNIPLVAFGIMINDEVSGQRKDFIIAPINRSHIALGYLLSAWVIGSIMEVVTIVFAEVYIVSFGGTVLPAFDLIKLFGASVISVAAYSTVFCFVALLIKSKEAFQTLCTIIGTLIGFIGGIYIPIGELPVSVQNVVKMIPITHTATLLRQIFSRRILSQVFASAPASAKSDFTNEFGLTLTIGNTEITGAMMILITLLTGVVFFVLTVLVISKKSRKKA